MRFMVGRHGSVFTDTVALNGKQKALLTGRTMENVAIVDLLLRTLGTIGGAKKLSEGFGIKPAIMLKQGLLGKKLSVAFDETFWKCFAGFVQNEACVIPILNDLNGRDVAKKDLSTHPFEISLGIRHLTRAEQAKALSSAAGIDASMLTAPSLISGPKRVELDSEFWHNCEIVLRRMADD